MTFLNPTILLNTAFHWVTSGFSLLVVLTFVAHSNSFEKKNYE